MDQAMQDESGLKIGDRVQLEGSAEQGRIIGRAEYLEAVPSYFVSYVDGKGCKREEWWRASALIKLD